MNRQRFILAACACAFLSATGCGKSSSPPPSSAPPQAQATQEPQSPPSTPTAPMPPPDVPKDDASSGPKPGQANDHSSPAFKGGGKEERK